MEELICIFYIVLVIFNIYLIYLFIGIAHDVKCIREHFEGINTKRKKETVEPILGKENALPSPSKTDLREFLNTIQRYKKKYKSVDKAWLEELISSYNSRFNEDFHQYA